MEVSSVYIKEIQMLDRLMELSLVSRSVAERDAEAKMIVASAELTAAKMMQETSETLNNPASMNIRWLETLNRITRRATIFFSIKS